MAGVRFPENALLDHVSILTNLKLASIRKSVPVAKWIRRWFPEPKIEGSSPFRDAFSEALIAPMV